MKKVFETLLKVEPSQGSGNSDLFASPPPLPSFASFEHLNILGLPCHPGGKS